MQRELLLVGGNVVDKPLDLHGDARGRGDPVHQRVAVKCYTLLSTKGVTMHPCCQGHIFQMDWNWSQNSFTIYLSFDILIQKYVLNIYKFRCCKYGMLFVLL